MALDFQILAIQAVASLLLPAERLVLFLISNDSGLEFCHINVILYTYLKEKSIGVKSGLLCGQSIDPPLPTNLPA
jgi:hypothetical protein